MKQYDVIALGPQIKEQAQGRTEVSSADNQVVSDSIARNIQAMNTKEASGDSALSISSTIELYHHLLSCKSVSLQAINSK